MKIMRLKIYEGVANIIALYMILDVVAVEFFSLDTFCWSVSMLFLAVAVAEFCHIPRLSLKQRYERDRSILNLIFYLVCGCLPLMFGTVKSLSVVSGLYFIAIPLTRVLLLITKKKVRNIIHLVISSAIFFPLGISILFMDAEGILVALNLVCVIILFRALFRIISISFSEIRLEVLKNIIRKTYASEIMFGLLLLIIAFSLVFYRMEPQFESYGDALWYCFAIVTTIGFGDYTATTLLPRMLSVVLGIYGIVVVALITSIVVSFYMEIRGERDNLEEKALEEKWVRKREAKKKKRGKRNIDKPQEIPEDGAAGTGDTQAGDAQAGDTRAEDARAGNAQAGNAQADDTNA